MNLGLLRPVRTVFNLIRTSGRARRPRWFRPHGIQGTLLLLIASVLIPLFLLHAGIYYTRFEQLRGAEYQANLDLARALSTTVDGFLRDVLRQEAIIGQAMAVDEGWSADRASALLTAGVRQYPMVRTMSWITPDGQVVASSNAEAVGLNVRDRSYFRDIVAGNDWSITDLTESRVTGQPTVLITRGIRTEDGRLQGIILSSVEPDRLSDALKIERSGSTGAYAVFDRQLNLVYWSPNRPLSWEQRGVAKQTPLLTQALAGNETVGSVPGMLDDRTRIIGAAPIASVGWVATAARVEEEVLVPIKQQFVRDTTLLLVVSAIAFGLARTISRAITDPLTQLQTLAASFATGDMRNRVQVGGPQETIDLTAVFNHMAQEIQRREEQRSEYLRIISHDLRTPLTVIHGQGQFLERALRKAGLAGQELHSAQAIVAGSVRMNTMIQELVDAARLEGGQVELHRQVLEPRAFTCDVVDRLTGLASPRRVMVQAAEHLPPVDADPDRLERILTNLISNALKYSPADMPVTVAIEQIGRVIRFTVTDRGKGLTSEEVAGLFQQYRRTAMARQHQEGLGLGLYITKGLVETHGGHIWVESTPGEGCAFHFTLPAAPETRIDDMTVRPRPLLHDDSKAA